MNRAPMNRDTRHISPAVKALAAYCREEQMAMKAALDAGIPLDCVAHEFSRIRTGDIRSLMILRTNLTRERLCEGCCSKLLTGKQDVCDTCAGTVSDTSPAGTERFTLETFTTTGAVMPVGPLLPGLAGLAGGFQHSFN